MTKTTFWMPNADKSDFQSLVRSKFGDKVKVLFRSAKCRRGVINSVPDHVYAVLTIKNCGMDESVRIFNALNEIPQVN